MGVAKVPIVASSELIFLMISGIQFHVIVHNLSRVTSHFPIHTKSGLVGSDILYTLFLWPPTTMHAYTHTHTQTCYASQGDSQVGAKGSSHVWEGVAPNRCTAITRLDPLHDPWPRATCSSLQKTYYQPAGSLSKPNDVAELTPWMNNSLATASNYVSCCI